MRRSTPKDEATNGHAAGQRRGDAQKLTAGRADLIRELQARRRAALRTQKSLNLQALAMARAYLGWYDAPDSKRKQINVESRAMLKSMRKGESPPRHLWCQAIRGFAELGLAIIVGEAGDLSDYGNPARLWKRLGLAPGPCYLKPTKSGKDVEQVPRERRAQMWTVGDSLIKGNRDYYRQVYEDRRWHEVNTAWADHPTLKHRGKDAKTGKDRFSLHVHRRAQRYMEKRLLRNLWREWKRTAGQNVDDDHVHPAGHLNRAGEPGQEHATGRPSKERQPVKHCRPAGELVTRS